MCQNYNIDYGCEQQQKKCQTLFSRYSDGGYFTQEIQKIDVSHWHYLLMLWEKTSDRQINIILWCRHRTQNIKVDWQWSVCDIVIGIMFGKF
jgi:hypothetical protein